MSRVSGSLTFLLANFNDINLDTFLINYGNALSINRFTDRFVMFNNIKLSTSYNNKLEKRFYNIDLERDIKDFME